MPDQAAIRCLKNGDIGGLEILITRYQTRAMRAAYFVIQDEQLAEDIVMDAFLDIYSHIHSFDESRPFQPYLMRSVVNKALNAARKRRREIPLEALEGKDKVESLLAQAVSVESQAEYAALQSQILTAVAALPARQRAAVALRYYLEMSEAEIASVLEAAPGTVKWLLHAARARLRALLGSQRSAR